jgi:Ca-activated chloride channel family protein
MQLVIDRSGSMQEHGRMQQLKKAVSLATAAINPGNQVGLISFSDQPQRHLALQPYDNNVRNRLLAAVSELQPDGPTALYDGLAVAMADLMRARRRDPSGRFVVLLLTDGNRTEGLALNDLKPVLRHSAITVLPIAYGEVNQGELSDIAAIREGAVYQGTPERIVPLINDLLQTNL